MLINWLIKKILSYHKENKKKYKENPFNVENWHYLEEQDEYICPANRPIPFKNDSRKIKVALFKISKSMNVTIVGTV